MFLELAANSLLGFDEVRSVLYRQLLGGRACLAAGLMVGKVAKDVLLVACALTRVADGARK